MEDDLLILDLDLGLSRSLPSLFKSSKTLGPTPSVIVGSYSYSIHAALAS